MCTVFLRRKPFGSWVIALGLPRYLPEWFNFLLYALSSTVRADLDKVGQRLPLTMVSDLPDRHSADARVQDAGGGAGAHLAHKWELLSPANTVGLHHLPGWGKTKTEKPVDYSVKSTHFHSSLQHHQVTWASVSADAGKMAPEENGCSTGMRTDSGPPRSQWPVIPPIGRQGLPGVSWL